MSGGCEGARTPNGQHHPRDPAAAAQTPSVHPAPAHKDGQIRTVQWSDSPWKPRAPARDWRYIVLHHTASDTGSVESIHEAHSQRRDADGKFWQGIGYHFVIGNGRGMDDGQVEPTFRWRQQINGAHAGIEEYNARGIGVCLVGNFEKHPPTPAQRAALTRLIQELAQTCAIDQQRVVLHSDVKATNCPGKLFPDKEILRASYPVAGNEPGG